MFLVVSVCCDTAQALVFLVVSVCCDTAQALVFLLVSVCCDTAQALVFLLDTAHTQARRSLLLGAVQRMIACCRAMRATDRVLLALAIYINIGLGSSPS